MSFISVKKIKGRERHYLEKSVRMPNGKIKKFSLYVKRFPLQEEEAKKYEAQLSRKIEQEVVEQEVFRFKKDYIFTTEDIRKLEEMKQAYGRIRKALTLKQREDILDRFAINFTYESNAIEGNSLTLKDVTFIIKEGKILPGKDLREVYETINTRKAMAWIEKNKPDITEKNILKLHELVVKDTGVALGYKQFPNFLLGRRVRTAPPELVQREMEHLIGSFHQQTKEHILKRAALFHGRFEQVHPFEDGNGRVGRLLLNAVLIKHGYPPLIMRKTQRIAYFHALEAFDNNHHDNLIRLMIERYKETYRKFFAIYVQYLK